MAWPAPSAGAAFSAGAAGAGAAAPFGANFSPRRDVDPSAVFSTSIASPLLDTSSMARTPASGSHRETASFAASSLSRGGLPSGAGAAPASGGSVRSRSVSCTWALRPPCGLGAIPALNAACALPLRSVTCIPAGTYAESGPARRPLPVIVSATAGVSGSADSVPVAVSSSTLPGTLAVKLSFAGGAGAPIVKPSSSSVAVADVETSGVIAWSSHERPAFCTSRRPSVTTWGSAAGFGAACGGRGSSRTPPTTSVPSASRSACRRGRTTSTPATPILPGPVVTSFTLSPSRATSSCPLSVRPASFTSSDVSHPSAPLVAVRSACRCSSPAFSAGSTPAVLR